MKVKLSPLYIIYGNLSVSKKRLTMYLRTIRNPWFTLLKISLFKPPWDITFRTNEKKRILNKNDLFGTVYELNHPLKGTEVDWTPKNTDVMIKIKTIKNNDGSEVFDQDIYGWLPVSDRIIVDIGANIGDSPIYFASKGAKHVFAFEADTNIFNIAICNIKKNSYQDSITLENRILLGTDHHEDKMIGSEWDDFQDFSHSEASKDKVQSITLNEILKENKIEDAVLKMDCEGCEYGVILSANAETIRHFSHIQMEYHFGAKKLKKKLTDIGYDVKVSRDRYSKSPDTRILMKAGDLYATRTEGVNAIEKK